jgi:hypothetical protein
VTWAPDYVTSVDVKAWSRVADSLDDTQIALYITTASRAVDNWCGRQFGQVAAPETREYTASWDRHLGAYAAEIDDIQKVDDLTVIGPAAQVVTDYELGPTNAAQKGRPFERLVTSTGGVLNLDGEWGWTTVPAAVKTATLLQTARLAKRRDSPFGIAGSPTGDGNDQRLLATLDPDLKTSLLAFRRNWWAA